MKRRGLAVRSTELINISSNILEEINPASVRSVCYQLFTRGVISSMKVSETQKVSRLLVYARETPATLLGRALEVIEGMR